MDRRFFLKSAGATTAGFLLARPLSGAMRSFEETLSQQVLFGVDYYPDQTPESLWEEDARRIEEAGLTNVRIAEFAWALMEPSEGRFDFAWLRRVVDVLHSHGIGVILGTPSAAPPPWLTQKYPGVFEVNDHGMTLSPEGRRFTCPTNKTYRHLSLNIATEMAKNFASTPGLIGWQIDNELTLGGSSRCYCSFCREGFQEWLRAKYGTLDAINQMWGTAFWSQIYTDFSQIPVPLPSGAPPNPGMALDYDRYQSYANVSFLEEQLRMLRTLCPGHFVTTNNVTLVDTINQRHLFANLNFVASDNYPGFYSVHLAEVGSSAPLTEMTPVISLTHDFSRSVKDGKPFLIMEEQVGKAGQPYFAPQPEKGQLRLWSYQAVAHGAMGINYFRWDTATFGAEEYWHGMLNHDRSKSAGFDEIIRTVGELKVLGSDALQASYAADAAICFDYDSNWAVAIQPGQPKLKYMNEVISWYGAAWAGHYGIDIVDATRDLSRYKIVFAPLMYVLSEKQADTIREYVRGGGIFVAGFRLGVKDPASRIVTTPLPGLLRDVMGVTVKEYVPIYTGKQGVKFSQALNGPDAECQIWADILAPEKADVLATYTLGSYAGDAAITSHSFGKGKAIYIGARLDPASLGRVLNTLTSNAGVKPEIEAPQGVEVTVRESGRNRWVFVLNHTSSQQEVPLSKTYREISANTTRSGQIVLEPYGVSVLQPV
ncbi:MAG TPA: beta-galactosidase [Pseudacidobacterium sp.]|jgi:beta-galactosidase|nr:beta-galactosidase [Pseudacidobacterium sp.]